jgi:hypothetical protein
VSLGGASSKEKNLEGGHRLQESAIPVQGHRRGGEEEVAGVLFCPELVYRPELEDLKRSEALAEPGQLRAAELVEASEDKDSVLGHPPLEHRDGKAAKVGVTPLGGDLHTEGEALRHCEGDARCRVSRLHVQPPVSAVARYAASS